VRNIIKCGASIERLSLYLRLGWQLERFPTEVGRLLYRTRRAKLSAFPGCLQVLENLSEPYNDSDKQKLLAAAEQLFSL